MGVRMSAERVVLKRVHMSEVPKGTRVWWHAYNTSSDWTKQNWPSRFAEVYVEVTEDE
jgi:hypothetical protein